MKIVYLLLMISLIGPFYAKKVSKSRFSLLRRSKRTPNDFQEEFNKLNENYIKNGKENGIVAAFNKLYPSKLKEYSTKQKDITNDLKGEVEKAISLYKIKTMGSTYLKVFNDLSEETKKIFEKLYGFELTEQIQNELKNLNKKLNPQEKQIEEGIATETPPNLANEAIVGNKKKITIGGDSQNGESNGTNSKSNSNKARKTRLSQLMDAIKSQDGIGNYILSNIKLVFSNKAFYYKYQNTYLTLNLDDEENYVENVIKAIVKEVQGLPEDGYFGLVGNSKDLIFDQFYQKLNDQQSKKLNQILTRFSLEEDGSIKTRRRIYKQPFFILFEDETSGQSFFSYFDSKTREWNDINEHLIEFSCNKNLNTYIISPRLNFEFNAESLQSEEPKPKKLYKYNDDTRSVVAPVSRFSNAIQLIKQRSSLNIKGENIFE